MAEAELSYEARHLIDKRDAALIRMNKELKRDLEQLKNKYIKRGDLESANRLNGYIKSIKISNPRWDALYLVQGKSFTWKRGNIIFTKQFVLDRSGKIKKYNNSNEATWSVDKNGALLIYNAEGKLQWTFKNVAEKNGKVYMETVGEHYLIEN